MVKLFKPTISQKFSNACKSYDKVAYAQKVSAQKLAQHLNLCLPNFNPKNILDCGTGTGYLPEYLIKHYPNANFTLNDISKGMIDLVKRKFSHSLNFKFHLGDMEVENFTPKDLIVSNFSLQWVESFQHTMEHLFKRCKVFVFSCLLDGTFDNWYQLSGQKERLKLRYPSKDDLFRYIQSLSVKSSKIVFEKFLIHFDSVHSFTEYLKNLGATHSGHSLTVKQLKYLLNYKFEPFNTYYNLGFVILEKQ